MSDKLNLNLTLPESKPVPARHSRSAILLVCILLVGILNLVLLLTRALPKAGPGGHQGLSASALKDLALKLEKQGLKEQAVRTWKEYLVVDHLTDEQRAKIWYRVGKIRQGQNQPEPALLAYYRSEKIHKLDDIANEINTRVQDCLEAAGRFAALRYELADRVGVDRKNGAASEVMAQVGTHKITREELDRKIETRVRRQLDSMAAYLSKEQRREQQQELMKKLSTRQARQDLLRRMIFEEMLYRKAREDKLDRKPEIRGLLRDSERSLLANQVLQREMAGKVNITPGDIQTYYEARKQEFMDNKAKPPRQKSLTEVQSQIYQLLHARKMNEIQSQLFAELRDRYDVVIHMPLVSGSESKGPSEIKKQKAKGKRQK